MPKKIKMLITILSFLSVSLLGISFFIANKKEEPKIYDINQNVNNSEKDLNLTEETKELANSTINATNNKEDLSTREAIVSTENEEKAVVDNKATEEGTEIDATIDQENISYNGDITGSGTSLLGAYQGLTYYNQGDSRWASIMYSSIGDSSQTMKSSACGPTSAAMVVSSSKGAILPTTMAQLAVDNGYRTAGDGTAWSFYSFVADYFNFNDYHTTSDFNSAMNYLKTDNDNDGNADYYIICSCGSGLFTSGGHYITLVNDDNGTITVYDPFLYNGKFNTASRRGAGAVVSGNSVYVSENSFKNYANYKYFWIYSNDKGKGNTNINTDINSNNEQTNTVNYIRYVATQNVNLNIRSGPGINNGVTGSLLKGIAVVVQRINGNWSYITSPVSGWVSSSYLSSSSVSYNSNSSISSSYSAKITASSLRIRSEAGTNYKILGSYSKGTTVTIINTSNGWGKTSKGWIYLGYTIKTSNYSTSGISTSYRLGRYKVTSASTLNVRYGPGTSYSIKKTYSKYTVFDTYQISGNWARTPSGWVCIKYCSLTYKY